MYTSKVCRNFFPSSSVAIKFQQNKEITYKIRLAVGTFVCREDTYTKPNCKLVSVSLWNTINQIPFDFDQKL